MVLERIYVVRHGFRSSWSVDHKTGVYTGLASPTGIAGDPALTSYGVDQAEQLGRHLMTLDPKVDKVYSSPYYRCLQTMRPFVQLGGAAKILPEHGIREWFGAAPFDHPEPAEPAVLKAMFPAWDGTYVSAVTPSRRGETLQQLQERVATALKVIIAQCDADGSRAVVLCSHAAVIIIIGRILTGQIPLNVDAADFHAYTCGLSIYRRATSSHTSSEHDHRHDNQELAAPHYFGGWTCLVNSDCSFLAGGAERGWTFSGDESFPDTGSLSRTGTEHKL